MAVLTKIEERGWEFLIVCVLYLYVYARCNSMELDIVMWK